VKYNRLYIKDTYYFTAKQLASIASELGIDIPVDSKGQRHPGTIFNNILKSMGVNTRKALGINQGSVVSVLAESCPRFISLLLEYDAISTSSIRDSKVDLYTQRAGRVILQWLSKSQADIEFPHFKTLTYSGNIVLEPKALGECELSAPSLIGKAVLPKRYKVIDQFTPEEQEVIRRYQKLVKETRKDGSRKVFRRN